MNVVELAKQCVDSINHPERSHPDKPLVTLIGKSHSLFPKRGWPRPKRLLGMGAKGGYVYHYDATNVLAALVAHGLVCLADHVKEGAQS